MSYLPCKHVEFLLEEIELKQETGTFIPHLMQIMHVTWNFMFPVLMASVFYQDSQQVK